MIGTTLSDDSLLDSHCRCFTIVIVRREMFPLMFSEASTIAPPQKHINNALFTEVRPAARRAVILA